jgi:hypothetical protein
VKISASYNEYLYSIARITPRVEIRKRNRPVSKFSGSSVEVLCSVSQVSWGLKRVSCVEWWSSPNFEYRVHVSSSAVSFEDFWDHKACGIYVWQVQINKAFGSCRTELILRTRNRTARRKSLFTFHLWSLQHILVGNISHYEIFYLFKLVI